MLTIESVENPQFADETGNVILVQVKFAEFEDILPFHAMPNDPMPYGAELYHRLMAGDFGTIAPFEISNNTPQPSVNGAQTI